MVHLQPRFWLSKVQRGLKLESRIRNPCLLYSNSIHRRTNCTKQALLDHEDLFRYTSGRWLWNESQHLKARYKKFDVGELKRVAAASTGAHSCISITKIAEGGFNRVFRLVMSDGSAVIARIPMMADSAPQQRTRAVASEVATRDFVCFPPRSYVHSELERALMCDVVGWVGAWDTGSESDSLECGSGQ